MKYIKSYKIFEIINVNFNNWFKNSKVINLDGTPKIVYHGSDSEDIDIFSGNRGIGWFTPDKKYAENYDREGGIYEVYLSIKNPFVLNIATEKEISLKKFKEITNIDIKKKYQGYDGENEIRKVWDWYDPSLTNFLDKLYQLGYDGLKTFEYQKYECWLPFNENQIKSINNNGDYSDSENIYK